MKPNDPNIRWIEEPRLGLSGRMYLPLVVQGLTTTARHLVSKKVTVSFPEERPHIGNPLIYRGVHRLNKDAEGRVKCVACFLCATACPSSCIYIEAAENTAEVRISGGERYAKVYNIDYNRCIFCGYCVEACPTDAITHGHGFEVASFNTSDLIYRKERLLESAESTPGGLR